MVGRGTWDLGRLQGLSSVILWVNVESAFQFPSQPKFPLRCFPNVADQFLRLPQLGTFILAQNLETISTPGLQAAVLQPMGYRSESCSLDSIQQDMERLPRGKRRLAVFVRMETAPRWLWSALTDYEQLHRFIPNLESSRLIKRRGDLIILEQVGTQQFCGLRFSARVQLEIKEELDQGLLNFRMIEGDFRCFQGGWQVTADESGTRLFYELTVQGKPGMPIGLIEQRLQQDLASNVRGVQQEANRREQKYIRN